MARHYTPRRAGARWREEAPAYILDCFDDQKSGERYTIFFAAPFVSGETYANARIPYLGMSDAPTHPQGISMWGELDAYQASAYRYSNGRHRVRWLDLPEHIRAHIIARATHD